MQTEKDWFELCLDKYPDLPSVVLIRSLELKHFPREFLTDPVLDLCCGDGFFTRTLGLRGVYGCDLDAAAVRQAAAFTDTYAGAVVCDARTLDAFPDSRFSTVFSNCALEHVDGIEQAANSIARVLMPGGRLIMNVPCENLNNWFFPKAALRRLGLDGYGSRLCGEYNGKQQHLNICSLDEWRDRLAAAGLHVEKSFFLFEEREYRLVTFFESFVVDSFPGSLFRSVYSLFRRATSLRLRKALWRKLLKPVYREAEPRSTGAELFIIARKRPSSSAGFPPRTP